MSDIKIIFKDKTMREFKHQGRAGGSYTKRIKYENGFVMVIDEWGNVIAFPADTVREVQETPHERYF